MLTNDEDLQTLEVGDGLIVVGTADAAKWLNEARALLRPLHSAGLRGSMSVRDLEDDFGLSRWSSLLTLPGATGISVFAESSSEGSDDYQVTFSSNAPVESAEANSEEPDTVVAALVLLLTHLAYARCADDGVWSRTDVSTRARVRHVSVHDGTTRVDLRRPSGKTGHVYITLGDTTTVELYTDGHWTLRTVDMTSEVEAAHLGRTLGLEGRRAQVAADARAWLAELIAAPENDPALLAMAAHQGS